MPIDKERLGDALRAFVTELDAEGYENWGWTLYKDWGDEPQCTLRLNGGSVGFTVTLCPGIGEVV